MHPVDRAAALLFRYALSSQRVFSAGWGDAALIESIRVPGDVGEPEPIVISWEQTAAAGPHEVTDGTFVSPLEQLPGDSRLAHLRRITPAAPDGRLVVMMAAWNEHGYRTRESLARLLADRGVTSVMLENPYYGQRRVCDDPPIRTVADFAVMGRGAVTEGRALLAHFATDHRVGVTGYSMGGNIAALIGALMEQPVAIAALAASHSPGPVWLDGILHHMIDWEALGGRDQAGRLRDVLTRASVLAAPAPPHTAGAVIVAGRRDGYIPMGAVEALHSHWPGSELRWLNGGHATMMWRHKDRLVDAIAAAFDRTFAGL